MKKFLLIIFLFSCSDLLLIEISEQGKDLFSFFPEKQEASPEPIQKIIFTGDVMLGRHVETIGKIQGFDSLFLPLSSLFLSSTYVIANLEGPLPDIHQKTPGGGFRFNFLQDTADILSKYHITAVSLANNHTFDAGENGYEDTLKKLSDLHIASFGHSRFFKPDYITTRLGGLDVSVVGVNLITPSFDEKGALDGINAVCDSLQGKPLVAFIHAGTEYRDKQSSYQVVFAHKLIDETCVRAIVGSHPHVVEGIERYKGKFIFYSLGNFIFDQYFSKETMEGLLLSMEENKGRLLFTLLPVYSEKSVPYLATGDERKMILERIASSSDETLRPFIKSGFLYEE